MRRTGWRIGQRQDHAVVGVDGIAADGRASERAGFAAIVSGKGFSTAFAIGFTKGTDAIIRAGMALGPRARGRDDFSGADDFAESRHAHRRPD